MTNPKSYFTIILLLFFVKTTHTQSMIIHQKSTGTTEVNINDVDSITFIKDGFETENSVYYAGKEYSTKIIGNKTWMTENLNYMKNDIINNLYETICFENSQENCQKYGMFYSWTEALNLDDSCGVTGCSAKIDSINQGVCPTGWHIPSINEWSDLIDYFGGKNSAAKSLKASAPDWDGDNTSGFNALPSGNENIFNDNSVATFWAMSSTKPYHPIYIKFGTGSSGVEFSTNIYREYTFSIRCIKN